MSITPMNRVEMVFLEERRYPQALSPSELHDVTALLGRWRGGSAEAEAALMERIQRELRRLAASYLRRERIGHTLQPTALVNEAYIRLVSQRPARWENRAHFFGIAARMMRRVLVDHARRRRSAKRDGLAGDPVSISGIAASAARVDPVDVLDLHEALSELAALDPRQAEIVEQRYFAGLTVEEIAEVMQISPATVKREWVAARLWLRRRMKGG
jgi:RNA polymerase sigma-70 factor (ECF subfamily)